MPGRTPVEAVDAFLEPLKSAVSVLGAAKIVTSPGGRSTPGVDHAWSLNGETGYSSGGWHFEAAMHYRIIRDGRPDFGPWRVTTRGYRYRLSVPPGEDVFRMHWHPTGRSNEQRPHMHLALAPSATVGDTLKEHFPSDRQTFEQAIRWAIGAGLAPARSDWQELLEQAERLHLQYRSWSGRNAPGVV